MTFSNINVSNPNDGLGDKLRDAFIIVNDNFDLVGDMVTPEQLSATLSNYATILYVNGKDTILQNQINGLSASYTILSGSFSSLQTQVTSLGLLLDGKASLTQLNNSVANINDTIATLQIDVDNKIEEAPQDDKTYGRNNANWVEVGSSVNKVVGRLYQVGSDSETSQNNGELVIGRTYWIKADSFNEGDDFSNCGDNQNTPERRFIATATTPANWSNGSILFTQEGAPVMNILENSLLEPFYFEYVSSGDFRIKSYDSLFTVDKTFTLLSRMGDLGLGSPLDVKIEYIDKNEMTLRVDEGNDQLSGYCLEIRVYE
jgi:hypothetical protein